MKHLKKKTPRKLPCLTDSVIAMRSEIAKFCKDWPRVALTFSDSNKFYKVGKNYFQAEELFQIAVAAYLVSYRTDITFFHPKNESKGGFTEQARKKLMGVVPGVTDLFLRKEGLPPLWIELKVKPNRPNNAQNEFMDTMRKMGDKASVCYDFEQVLDALEMWEAAE